MCIIIYKAKGIEAPSQDIIRTCFENNPDGAGIAILRQGEKSVHIHKGFMDVETFIDFIEYSVKPSDIVGYHFRIGTSGGNMPENTHPFPVSDNVRELKQLNVVARYAFLHNGILGSGEKDLSDTQLFIRDELFPLRYSLQNKNTIAKLEKLTQGSRTLTIDGQTGFVVRTGDWIEDKETGLFFSNSSYQSYKSLYSGDMSFFSDCCPMCGSTYTDLISERNMLFECISCGTVFDDKDNPLVYGDGIDAIEDVDNETYEGFRN